MKIAVLGGTGRQGSGLALRWARVGHELLIGSREAARAEQVAARLSRRLAGAASSFSSIRGMDNRAAADACELAVLSVPYAAQLSTLETARDALVGKWLISVVVPLQPPELGQVWRPEAGSAAQEAQRFLGPGTPVIAAFHTISSGHLVDLDHEIDSDVLVCADQEAYQQVAQGLVRQAGMRPVWAGPLVNASVVEGMTALLIHINLHYRLKGVGLRITGLNAEELEPPAGRTTL